MADGKIVKISGPLIVAEGMGGARMFEVARVSDRELIGEIIIVSLADRFGLKRMILLGACLTAVCNALLPLFGTALPLALCGLFIVFICFEFTD